MRRNDRRGLGRLALALGAVTLLFVTAVPTQAQEGTPAPGALRRPDPRKAGGARLPKPSSFNLASSPTFLLNYNSWLCGLQQIGEVCTSSVGSSVGGGGFWPEGTANQYIFNSGLQVAAVIGPDGGAAANDTVATFFFNASASGAGAAVTPIFASNRPEDLAAWPEDCYLDNPVFGRVKTLSELDTCVQYWDGDPTASHFTDSRPMGLLVTQHSLLWSFPSNKDIMFFIYKFKNVSNTAEFRARNPAAPAAGWTLTNVYSAFAMDPDVSGGEYIENFATVVPELDLGVAWQYDFEAADFVPYPPNFDAAVGFVGVKFLKSPLHTGDQPVTVSIGNRTRTVNKGEELGMTFFSIFTNGGIMSDASNGQQAFRYLSGRLLATERSQWCPASPPGMCYVNLAGPDDMRFYQSSGPFTLKPGEEAEIVVAYVAGAPVPGTYTKGTVIPVGDVTNQNREIEKVMGRGFERPGFPSLFANARTAQAIYDADFVLPSSPTAPVVTVVPGDKQNSVIWDAAAVARQDPYCTLASDPDNPLYDPNFRCEDFEGFRVYRKSNPSADWTPIAQFDLTNGIGEVVTVQQEVETADGSILIVKADTARVCRDETKEQLGLASDFAGCRTETGLKFAIVDRGGAFPNPESGPGLINGIRYYYAVTAFDINSPQSGPNSLESARVLSNAASGVPRSTASNIVAAQFVSPQLFGAGNTPLDTTRTVTINAQTGTFSGPQPPTDGFRATLDVFNALALKPGDVSIRIDSIVPLNGYEDILGIHEQHEANALGVSAAYFYTVTTPDGTTRLRREYSSPFCAFGAPCEGGGEIVSSPVKGSSGDFAASFAASLKLGPEVYVSGAEAVGALRSHLYEDHGGSRWFSGATEPAEPTLNAAAGRLPGVDTIVGLTAIYQRNANLRWMVYMLSPLYRAVDYEVTWGANGTIDRVMDMSHNVEVPFNETYRGSWGVLNERSGDGILTMADFWYVTPVSEWYCEVEGCHIPLERVAKIQPLQIEPPAGYGDVAAAASGTGFGLYIAGEQWLFRTATLPAAGTKWTLRTYAGIVEKTASGYTFTRNYDGGVVTRPPTITGLTLKATVTAATAVNADSADLTNVHPVPDPYYVTNRLENTSAVKRMQFVNLPAKAVVRIYSLSGVLLAVLNHEDLSGGGTMDWDLRTRNNQFIASGVYFYHVEAPNGKTKMGKFTVIQYAQ